MARSEFAMGSLTLAFVIAAGWLSTTFVDRHFAAIEAAEDAASNGPAAPAETASPGACVDEDGSWKNWPFPNVPALAPKCPAKDR